MSFAKVYSAQPDMLSATIITVEADISRGLHSFSIIGLPDKAIEEAKDRISAAVKNSGFDSPKSKSHKVILSLAPADLRKEGPRFDVSLALAYLRASDEIRFDPEHKLFLGELSLDGNIRPVSGILSLAREAANRGFTELYVPYENAAEASLISSITIFAIKTFSELINHLRNRNSRSQKQRVYLLPYKSNSLAPTKADIHSTSFNDIKGQTYAKRALEIAASGGHNCALYGPPGTGKTMLASSFISLLPDLTYEQRLDVISIHSVVGLNPNPYNMRPPLRTPHHTASYNSIIGGGQHIKPGELTLAHHGVLFLDEFSEFDQRVIDALRQPLEDKTITISRIKGSVTFPAHCTLLVAFNPCPCGNLGSQDKPCTCLPSTLAKYRRKLSGPIIDRIDLWSNVSEVNRSQLDIQVSHNESVEVIRTKILKARTIQLKRFKAGKRVITLNSEMNAEDIPKYCQCEADARKALLQSSESLKLSARSHHKVLKIARTIADLSGKEKIDLPSILEALQYRPQLPI